jgi:hypothetical protein
MRRRRRALCKTPKRSARRGGFVAPRPRLIRRSPEKACGGPGGHPAAWCSRCATSDRRGRTGLSERSGAASFSRGRSMLEGVARQRGRWAERAAGPSSNHSVPRRGKWRFTEVSGMSRPVVAPPFRGPLLPRRRRLAVAYAPAPWTTWRRFASTPVQARRQGLDFRYGVGRRPLEPAEATAEHRAWPGTR